MLTTFVPRPAGERLLAAVAEGHATELRID